MSRRGPCEMFAGADYSKEEVDWLRAVDGYKRQFSRQVLSPGEILALARSLGYRQVSGEPSRTTAETTAG